MTHEAWAQSGLGSVRSPLAARARRPRADPEHGLPRFADDLLRVARDEVAVGEEHPLEVQARMRLMPSRTRVLSPHRFYVYPEDVLMLAIAVVRKEYESRGLRPAP